MIEIRSRSDGRVLYAAETAQDVRAAVVQAVASESNLRESDLSGANLSRANLRESDLYGANLRESNLRGANLGGASLYGADLYGASLRESNLSGANLYGANLGGADLSRANLYGANLGGADLSGANLSGADLRESDLYGANLRGANLRGASLSGANLSGASLAGTGILHVEGLPSGTATLIPEPDGWALQIGCWSGTTTELREMIARDNGWPEAEGAQIVERRPMLAALADMADAWAEAHSHLLAAVQETHRGKSE